MTTEGPGSSGAFAFSQRINLSISPPQVFAAGVRNLSHERRNGSVGTGTFLLTIGFHRNRSLSTAPTPYPRLVGSRGCRDDFRCGPAQQKYRATPQRHTSVKMRTCQRPYSPETIVR